MRQRWIVVLAGLLLVGVSGAKTSNAAAVYYQPERVKAFGQGYPDKIVQLANTLEAGPAGFGIAYQDRSFWGTFEKTEEGRTIVRAAEKYLGEKLPVVTEELYMDYFVTGNRTRCQAVISRREGRLVTLCLAECIENKGRFVKAFEEVCVSMCNDLSWVLPAHDSQKQNYLQKKITIDLVSARHAHDFALALVLLNDKLDPNIVELVREKLHAKIFKPYIDDIYQNTQQAYWKTATHNWNAVCHAGVVGAALTALPNEMDRALFADRGIRYMDYFYEGFTPDGYCSEGLGYWSYGYGHYIVLSEEIYCATGGRTDVFADPRGLPAALYPFRLEILNGSYPAIADCSPNAKPDGDMMGYVNTRLGLEDKRWPLGTDTGSLFMFLMHQRVRSGRPKLEAPFKPDNTSIRTFFEDAGVLICRPNAGWTFAAVLKGGHNAEHHNHNDLGSFTVLAGKEQVILDAGAVEYTSTTFGKDRYTIKKLSSYGHDVPLVAGQEQVPGAKAKAVILQKEFSDEKDLLTMDLTSAYNVTELEQLHRTFTFSRQGAGWLEVRDDFAFSEPKAFEAALISYGTYKKTGLDLLEITTGGQTVCVSIAAQGSSFEIADEIIESTKGSPLRIAVRFSNPVKKGQITMKIWPK